MNVRSLHESDLAPEQQNKIAVANAAQLLIKRLERQYSVQVGFDTRVVVEVTLAGDRPNTKADHATYLQNAGRYIEVAQQNVKNLEMFFSHQLVQGIRNIQHEIIQLREMTKYDPTLERAYIDEKTGQLRNSLKQNLDA